MFRVKIMQTTIFTFDIVALETIAHRPSSLSIHLTRTCQILSGMSSKKIKLKLAISKSKCT